MELLEELEKLKQQLEKEATKRNVNCNVLDINYYKSITFDEIDGKEQPLYLIEKEVDGKIEKQLQLGDTIIADIFEGNLIQIREEFSHMLKEKDILIELRDTMPISLNDLEKRNEKEQQEKTQNKTNEEIVEDNKRDIDEAKRIEHNPKDIEIDMDKKITSAKTFADLVPEVKEKQIEKVKVRRIDGTRFEFYGENDLGQEVAIESLRSVEGTNPNKEINKINADGSQVEKEQVYSMFQIVHGTNEQNGNEGFSVDLEEGTGIVEIGYYRRSRDNEYTSIPVKLRNTNQKRTEKNVQEFAQKERNPEVSDNIERANRILEEQESTSIENIDDDLNNDIRETQTEYEDSLIKEAAQRCKISEEGFREVLEQERREGEPIEDSIERAEDEINEQVIGERLR